MLEPNTLAPTDFIDEPIMPDIQAFPSQAPDMPATDFSVAAPSGKNIETENFPVGSILLPKHLRNVVHAYYIFARKGDDIADAVELSSEDKLNRLEWMYQALTSPEWSHPNWPQTRNLRHLMLQHNIPLAHAADLITAFKQDAKQTRYQNWSDLATYCRYSASPVGRFLLCLHTEDSTYFRYSDPLCDALQIINHLQDCQDDYQTMDRVYLPLEWMQHASMPLSDLKRRTESHAFQQVKKQALQEIDRLLEQAAPLSTHLTHRSIAFESAVIHQLALGLRQKLHKNDLLAKRVGFSKIETLFYSLLGLFNGVRGRRIFA